MYAFMRFDKIDELRKTTRDELKQALRSGDDERAASCVEVIVELQNAEFSKIDAMVRQRLASKEAGNEG